MRILQLITQDRGGPVDHAVDLAAELARTGHDSRVAGPAGPATRAAAGRGVRWHELDVSGKFDVRGWRAAARVLDAVRPDVLHCQDRRAGLVGRLLARRHGLPSVYTLHGVDDALAHLVPGNLAMRRAGRREAFAYHVLERRLARIACGPVVVPCTALRGYAIEHIGLPAAQVRVVPNGVHPRWLAPLPRPLRPAGEHPTAVWLGLMEPVKRLPDLLDAVADVPDLRLVLVGDGPERGSLERRVARLRLAGRVSFAGFRDDPAPLLAAADVFVLPSAAEACPMALLQAMAVGLPSVATAVGGVPEIVRHDTDGLVVPPGSPGDLREALLRLAKDAALRGEMGASARDRVARHFALDRSAAALLDVYEEAS